MTRLSTLRGRDADQVPRLTMFRERYPHIEIVPLRDAAVWQARIPGDDEETVLTRYELGDLLDRLAEVLE